MIYATYLANLIRPKARFASIIGSYGWGGQTVEILKGMLTHIKPEILEPVIVKGQPTEETMRSLDRLAEDIIKKHTEIGILPKVA